MEGEQGAKLWGSQRVAEPHSWPHACPRGDPILADCARALAFTTPSLQASRKAEQLRGRLAELAAHEAALDGQLCYGLPPGWPGAARVGSAAGGAGAVAAGFEWEEQWRAGTEVGTPLWHEEC